MPAALRRYRQQFPEAVQRAEGAENLGQLQAWLRALRNGGQLASMAAALKAGGTAAAQRPYAARLSVGGQLVHITSCATAQEAAAAYDLAAMRAGKQPENFGERRCAGACWAGASSILLTAGRFYGWP